MEYNYLDNEGLKRLIENSIKVFSSKNHVHVPSDITGLDDILNSFMTKQQYEGIINFPNIGDPECLYIDTLANKTYRWDDVNLKYYCIGSDYNDIELIICGDSTENK